MNKKIKISTEELTIASRDYKLYGKLYVVDKDSPTIILLHGLGFYSFEYERLTSLLSENSFNCLAFDFRCHGKSGGKRGYWTLQELVDDTKSIVDYTYNRFNDEIGIFGNSLGATVGVCAAAEDEENKIKSLVASNCATRPIAFGMNNFRKFLLTLSDAISKIIPFRVSVNHFIPYTKILSDPKIIKRIRNDKLISDARRFSVSTYKNMLSWDITKIAGKTKMPVLVVSSKEDDFLQTKTQSMLLFSALREPKELKLIDSGHVPHLEAPELVNGILCEWFDKTLKGDKL